MRKHGQRGQCIKRVDKTYLLRVPLGHDETGKRRYKNETFHGLKKDALERLTAMLGEKDSGLCLEPTTATLDEYLDRWLDLMETRIGPHAHSDYAKLMRLYVRPVLGKQPLAKVGALEIEAIHSDMVTKGLSRRTIEYTHVTLKQALQHAVDRDLLPRNPAGKVKPPKPNAKPKELRAFDQDQAAAFLESAKADRLGAMFLTALTTGMRPGEYFGLKWSDVDFEKSTVTVQRALIPFGPDGWSFALTKTEKSRRIQLPTNTVQALRDHRRQQAAERLKAGPDWQNHDLVFCTSVGGPLEIRNVTRRHLEPVLKAAGLPKRFTLYSLRHSNATLSLAAGVNVKEVSERLGHANITMTLQNYSHVLPSMQAAAVEVWQRISSGN